jgi:4-hydroxybenzoate polyprenyltransferase
LPRGLLTPANVSSTINRGVLVLLAYGFVLIFARSWQAGVNQIIITGWLWLMYKEFYAGRWLADRPLSYAITHQVILLPVCSLAVLAHRPDMLSAPQTWFFAITVLGSFFSYEVCRKLDPKAHDLQKTYLATYGPWRTFAIVLVLNLIAAAGAWASGLTVWLWPFEILTVLLFLGVIAKPETYKLTEAAATLSLLFHIWGMSFAYFWNFFVGG